MISQSFLVSELLTLSNIPLDSLQYNSLLTVMDVFSSPLNSITRVFVCETLHDLSPLPSLSTTTMLNLVKDFKCAGHMNPVLVLIPFHGLVEAQMDQLN